MPTENRSSNTDPRDVFIRLNPLGLGEAELRKDSTGFEDQRTHSDYLLFLAGYRETHPEPQHQGEPVAWMRNDGVVFHTAFLDQFGSEYKTRLQPLYTRADPGEVEELRDLADRQANLLSETAVELRGAEPELHRHGHADIPSRVKAVVQELAGRDALLRELADAPPAAMEFRLQQKVKAALSASAEPSVPTPQTINGHKLNCKAVDDYKPGECSCGAEPGAREAQALQAEKSLGIERLPAEQSAPADRAEVDRQLYELGRIPATWPDRFREQLLVVLHLMSGIERKPF